MKTNGPVPSIKTPKATQLALDYSENPKALRAIIQELDFEIFASGPHPFFIDDTDARVVLDVTVRRASRPMALSFSFGMSLRDTWALTGQDVFAGRSMYKCIDDKKAVHNGLLYSLLCTIRCESYCPTKFKDFCGEYGYSDDSIRAKETWEKLLAMSTDVQAFFTRDEIDALPS
jgi:hypothetical protein